MSGIELSRSERDELDWLRKENRLLRVEKDMLVRMATECTLVHTDLVAPRSWSAHAGDR